MAKRPLFQKGIKELESLFAEKRHDTSALNQLSDELAHRKTKRAQALRKKVETALQSKAAPTTTSLPTGLSRAGNPDCRRSAYCPFNAVAPTL